LRYEPVRLCRACTGPSGPVRVMTSLMSWTMRSLHDATERICELKGDLIAQEVLTTSLLLALSPEASMRFRQQFARASETARVVLFNAPVSEHTLMAFERGIQRTLTLMGAGGMAEESARLRPVPLRSEAV